jgi:hypothetical protein
VLADKYLEFSKGIENEICKVLDTWVKTKEADRKKVKKKKAKRTTNCLQIKSRCQKH